jgi:hypothetical protein
MIASRRWEWRLDMGDANSQAVDRAEHYRALARAIASLVSSAKSVEARRELEVLATDYDLLASYAELQSRARPASRKALAAGRRQTTGYWLTSPT